jgi:uncharacterized membrane protein
MAGAFGILCAFVFVVAVILWLVAVPLYLLIRSFQFTALRNRLDRLEHELAVFRGGERREAVEPVPVLERAEAEHEVKPPVAERSPHVQRAPEPPRLPYRRREPRPSLLANIDLEAWIGKRGLGWIAVILLFFATAFFVKQAFDSNLIGNLGRVALGVLAGAALCIAGYFCHLRRYRVFSQMLTSAGIILLYLTTFASFGYYALMPQRHAGVFFVLIVVESAVLAWLYDAPAIAIMAVIGGLLTPLLLHTGRDQYPALFTYLTILNVGAVALHYLRRSWHALATIALLGTQGVFWLWYAENYHPEKLYAAALFQAALFALYLTPSFIQAGLQQAASIEDLLRLVVKAIVFTAWGYVLLDPHYHNWMGVFVLGVAIVYAALASLISIRNAADQRHLLVVIAATLGLVAMVFPIQANGAWIGLGWAVEGALLWWFGLRIRSIALRAFAVPLLAMAIVRVFYDAYAVGHGGPYIPLFNKYGTPATLVALCVLFCAAVSRLSRASGISLDHVGMWVAGVGGVLLLWFIVSYETYDWFMVQIDRRVAAPGTYDMQGRNVFELQQMEIARLQSYARLSLSVVWAVYAAIILTIGFVRQNRPLRWTALGIFAVTLLKVTMIDIGSLGGYYRVAAFFMLAVAMALGAWIYQRIQLTLAPPHEGVQS